MHRILPNILFVLILFILATAFPLSTDILSLNLSQKIVDKPVDDIIVDAELTLVLPTEFDSIANEFITFNIESNSNLFPNEFLSDYSLVVSRHGQEVLTKPLSELSYEIVDTSAKVKTIQVLKTGLLETLDPGYYTSVLISPDETFDYTWYGSNVVYDKMLLKTSAQLNAGQINFTLFFPTHDYKNLVPLSRQIPLPENRWRTLYTALLNGPKAGLGLYETAPIFPYVPNIRISNGIANIYMYGANLVGFEEKYKVLTDAVTKTFMTMGSLEGVNFYVDGTNKKPYSEVDLTQTFKQTALNSVYVGYSHETKFMMLMPVPLKLTAVDDRVKEAWEMMKLRSDTALFTADMLQVIPDEVQLLDYTLEGSVLTLNVSKSFESNLNAQPEYNDLMVKSILYTYVSFPEVETIKITVEGAPLISAGYDFAQPIIPDLYFNLEP